MQTLTFPSRLAPVVLFAFFIVPIPVFGAGIEQHDREALASGEPRASGGWIQILGTGLSGTASRLSLPISIIGGSTYGPKFMLTILSCADAAMATDCQNRYWLPEHAALDPFPFPMTARDATLTFELRGEPYIFEPHRHYQFSIALSLFLGGPGEGSFLPYGSTQDRYAGGSTDATGLADLAFSIDGVVTEQPPTPEPEPPPGPIPLPYPPSERNGISSVFFLPGLKASRLYEAGPLCGLVGISCNTPRWLPLADAFAPSLFVNPDADSSGIFARVHDLIYEAFGRRFYRTLADRFDEAQRDGTFGPGWQWLPVAYDWRLASERIARAGVREDDRILFDPTHANDSGYLLEELRALASSSPTGKATIIAHSYGGIVAWRLIEALGTAASSTVDRLILVGVPQLGAPRALGALLFGDREAIPGFKFLPDPILSEEHARQFSRTSPAAYELLPSAGYFESEPAIPLLSFDTAFPTERDRYGESINTADELVAYAAAREGARQDPPPNNLSSPAVLPEGMVAHAYQRPNRTAGSIAIHQIGGWGESTIIGYRLYERTRFLFGAPNGTARDYAAHFSALGDGTVPIASAIDRRLPDAHSYWVDLREARRDGQRFSHGDLLESPQVLVTLEGIMRGAPTLPRGVSTEEPVFEATPDRLRIELGSPARLTATDTTGRVTGERADGRIEEEIPGSWFAKVGSHAFLELPSKDRYQVQVVGTHDGFVSLALVEAGSGSSPSRIIDLPISAGTEISFSISTSIADASAVAVDTNRDSVPDEHMRFAPGVSVPYRPSTILAPPAAYARPIVERWVYPGERVRVIPSQATRLEQRPIAPSVEVYTKPSTAAWTPMAPRAPEQSLKPSSPKQIVRVGSVLGTSTTQQFDKVSPCEPWWLRAYRWVVRTTIGIVSPWWQLWPGWAVAMRQ